ncbi:MAG: Hsp20/alpha crystallin family protein [Bacteriovorax sp.]|nr:Hsp20/alpha crystallin family protein [Bacteriovorax sp.]
MKKILFVLMTLLFSSSLLSQTKQTDLDAQIKEIMKAREEMIRSLFNDSDFGSFDDRMDNHFSDLIKKFQQNGFGGMPQMEMGDVVGEYDWKETENDVTLVLKVAQIKDKPLDIKIEKGQIKLKGDVESVTQDAAKKSKRISKVHFERIFSIPEGVDQGNPEFENKQGELLIKFKKLNVVKGKKQQITPLKKEEERRPLEKEAGDVSI